MKNLMKLATCGSIVLCLVGCGNDSKQTKEAKLIEENPQQAILASLKKNEEATSIEDNCMGYMTMMDGDGGKLNTSKISVQQGKQQRMKQNTTVFSKQIQPGTKMLFYVKKDDKNNISLGLDENGNVLYVNVDKHHSSEKSFMDQLKEQVTTGFKEHFTISVKENDKEDVVTYKLKKDKEDYLKTLYSKDDLHKQYKEEFANPDIKDYYYEFTINKAGELIKLKVKTLIDYGNNLVDDNDITYIYSKYHEELFDVAALDKVFIDVEKGKIKKGDSVKQLT